MYTKKDLESSFKEGFSKGITYSGGMVDEIFKESMDSITKIGSKGPITLDAILKQVAFKYEVPLDDIIYLKSRRRTYVFPRKITCLLSYWFTNERLEDIGAMIGNINHPAVSISVRDIEDIASMDKRVASAIQNVVLDLIEAGYTFKINQARLDRVHTKGRREFPQWLTYEL